MVTLLATYKTAKATGIAGKYLKSHGLKHFNITSCQWEISLMCYFVPIGKAVAFISLHHTPNTKLRNSRFCKICDDDLIDFHIFQAAKKKSKSF